MSNFRNAQFNALAVEFWRMLAPVGITQVKTQPNSNGKLLKIVSADGRTWSNIPVSQQIATTRFETLQLPCPRAQTVPSEGPTAPLSQNKDWVVVDWPLEQWEGWDLPTITDSVPYLDEDVEPTTHKTFAKMQKDAYMVECDSEEVCYTFFERWDGLVVPSELESIAQRLPTDNGGPSPPATFKRSPRNNKNKATTTQFDEQKLKKGKKGRIYPDYGLTINSTNGSSWAFVAEIKRGEEWEPSEALELDYNNRFNPEVVPSWHDHWPIRQCAHYCYTYQTPFAILRTENQALLLEFWIHEPNRNGKPLLRGRYHWIPFNPSKHEVSVLLATYALGIVSLSRRHYLRANNLQPGLGSKWDLISPAEWIERAPWPEDDPWRRQSSQGQPWDQQPISNVYDMSGARGMPQAPRSISTMSSPPPGGYSQYSQMGSNPPPNLNNFNMSSAWRTTPLPRSMRSPSPLSPGGYQPFSQMGPPMTSTPLPRRNPRRSTRQ